MIIFLWILVISSFLMLLGKIAEYLKYDLQQKHFEKIKKIHEEWDMLYDEFLGDILPELKKNNVEFVTIDNLVALGMDYSKAYNTLISIVIHDRERKYVTPVLKFKGEDGKLFDLCEDDNFENYFTTIFILNMPLPIVKDKNLYMASKENTFSYLRIK